MTETIAKTKFYSISKLRQDDGEVVYNLHMLRVSVMFFSEEFEELIALFEQIIVCPDGEEDGTPILTEVPTSVG